MWRWLLWGSCFGGWTILLVLPANSSQLEVVSEGRKYIVVKIAHVAVYAFLTILGGTLPMRVRFRWLLLFVIMAHGTASKLIQERVAGRTGTLHDVGFDHLGVLLGLCGGWKWWSKQA